MNRKRALISVGVVVLCLALWLGVAGVVLAQSPYTGLDVVFIIDRSGSMCGEACGSEPHPEPNDPHGLRYYGVQYAVSWLGQNQWQLHPDVAYQVAVVHFGTEAQKVNLGTADAPRYWETVAPGTENGWLVQEEDLEPRLAPGPIATDNLGYTNFVNAFELAQQLFAQLDADGAGQDHRRAIVVLTDGQPCLEEGNCQMRSQMEQVSALVQADFPPPRYTIYVVALNDAEAHYWDRTYAGYWADVTGDPARAQKVRLNETDVGVRFREILLELTHDLPGETITDVEIEAGPQIIPPYLAEVEFTFFKAEVSETPVITDALRRNVKALDPAAGVKVSGQDTPIEKVTIPNPEPGRWIVAVRIGSETRITMRQIPARGNMLQPTSVQYRYLPTQIVYQLTDLHGTPLPVYADPIYQLQVTATVQAGGQAWPTNLRLSGQSRYSADFVPSVLGSHVVHVEAASHDLEGKRIPVFAGNLNPFEVRALTAESRLTGNRLTQYAPGSLRFGLLDSANLSAAVAAQLTAQAVVTDTNGQPWTIPLQAQQVDELAGAFTPISTGLYQVRLIGKARDAQGREYLPLDVALPPLEVVAPTMVVQLSSPPYKQYGDVTVTYQLQDSSGGPLTLDPTYQPVVEARLEAADHQQIVLPQQTSPGVFTAVFSPTADGPQKLLSTFKVKNMASGAQATLSEAEQDLYVLATALVDIEITAATHRSQPVRSVLLQPQPLMIEVQFTVAGRPVEAAQVLGSDLERPLTIRVRDEQGRDRSGEMVWKPMNEPGLFRAEGENLGQGEYTVQVQADAPLKADYIYGRRSQQLTIRRVENPVLVGGAVGGSLLALLGLIVAGILVQRAIQLSKHPCRGYLVLTDPNGKILWQGDLEAGGKKKKNRWVFDLGLDAPLSLVETLVVTCDLDQDSQDNVVRVQATLDNGDEIGPYRMGPHDKQEMVTGISWLFKDSETADLQTLGGAMPPAWPETGVSQFGADTLGLTRT